MEVLSYITSNASDHNASVTKVPTFLAPFLSSTENVLLIHKKKVLEDVRNKTPKKYSNETSVIDLTGSPLQLDSEISITEELLLRKNVHLWLKHEEEYYPMSLEKARAFLNMYNVLPKSLNIQGMFCVCDGIDDNCSVLLGSSTVDGLFARHVMTVQGFVSRNDPSIQIEALMEKHFALSKRIPNSQTQTRVECTYNIYGSPYFSEDFDASLAEMAPHNGNVSLDIVWTTPSYDPPENLSEINLFIQAIVGHSNSEAVLLSTELELIQTFIDITSEYLANAEQVSVNDLVMPASINLGPSVMTKIQLLMKEQGDNATHLQKLSRMRPIKDHDLRTSVTNTYTRVGRDFTDNLWEILARATSYTELSNCLDYVLEEICTGNVTPYVCPENMTSFATLIRDVAKGGVVVRYLTSGEPIILLIEMGIEKMMKDFKYICYECNLPMAEFLTKNESSTRATNAQWSQREIPLRGLYSKINVQPQQSQLNILRRKTSILPGFGASRKFSEIKSELPFDQNMFFNNLKVQMTTLGKISTVLECLLLAKIHLPTLSNDQFDHLVDVATGHFMTEESPVKSFPELQAEPIHTLRLKIPSRDVLVGNEVCKCWKLIVTSENDHTGLKRIYYQSQQPTFPPVIYCQSGEDIEKTENDLIVFCSEYLYIWNNFTSPQKPKGNIDL